MIYYLKLTTNNQILCVYTLKKYRQWALSLKRWGVYLTGFFINNVKGFSSDEMKIARQKVEGCVLY